MSETIELLKSQITGLSTPERAELAQFLLSTLESDDENEAWCVEIRRRVAEIRSGKAIGRPAEVVMSELRELYP